MEVRNLFQLLVVEEGPNGMYDRLAAAHLETATECVPVLERIRGSPRSKHSEVVAAQEKELRRHVDFLPKIRLWGAG